MQPITSCDLRGLHGQPVAIAMKFLFQFGALRHYLFQPLGITSVGCAIALRHNSGGAAAIAYKQR